MRLTDLEPRWIGAAHWRSKPFYIGLSFLSPAKPGVRVGVKFYPPIDPGQLQAHYGPGWWLQYPADHPRLGGDTFNALTLEPPVGFTSDGWDGRITEGEIA